MEPNLAINEHLVFNEATLQQVLNIGNRGFHPVMFHLEKGPDFTVDEEYGIVKPQEHSEITIHLNNTQKIKTEPRHLFVSYKSLDPEIAQILTSPTQIKDLFGQATKATKTRVKMRFEKRQQSMYQKIEEAKSRKQELEAQLIRRKHQKNITVSCQSGSGWHIFAKSAALASILGFLIGCLHKKYSSSSSS